MRHGELMEMPMNRRSFIPFLTIAMAVASGAALAEQSVEVVARPEVKLQPLNPLRGDASPKAGVLWGDIKKDLSTGTLIEFADGFCSPPHIHNITYRAVEDQLDGVAVTDLGEHRFGSRAVHL